MKKLNILSFLILILAAFMMPVGAIAKSTILRLTTQNSENNLSSVRALRPWVEQVEKATKGKIKIEVYYSQTLAKGKESWKAVKSGIADIGWCPQGYWPGLTPLSDVITLPGLPFNSAEKGSELLWRLYSQTPEIQREFKDVKVLVLHTSDPYLLITRNKPVHTLEDIKGMKIRTFGSNLTMQVKKLGAVPVSIPMPDNYPALQKGVIDGMGTPWEAVNGFRFYEVVDHYTEVPFGALYFSVSMNKNVWNKLDKDVQDAIMSVSGLEGSKFWGKNFFDSAKQVSIESAAKVGKQINVTKLSDAERDRWIELSKPVWDTWIESNEKKGNRKAKEILDSVMNM
ncbi:MAG: TRAP transporter substrate-binding protein [Desulfobacterium sp.]